MIRVCEWLAVGLVAVVVFDLLAAWISLRFVHDTPEFPYRGDT